jgi:hypothetical protein
VNVIYTLPDGSNDAPDRDGRHTATVNVWHNAANAKIYFGCEHCASCIEFNAYMAVHGVRYGGWDQSLRDGEGDFTISTPFCLHPLEDGREPCTGIGQWRERGRPGKAES